MPHERRQAPRVEERISVAITEAGEPLQTETHNLSTIGAYCTTDRFLPPMTKLQLEFEVPNGGRLHPIRCTGVVVRAEPVVRSEARAAYQMGIFFTEITERDRAVIAEFVRERLARRTSGST